MSNSPDTHLVGFVDGVNDARVIGWAADTLNPNRTLIVEAVNTMTSERTSSIANEFRADLLAEKLGDGCHAFSLSLPHARQDEVILVRFVETGDILTNGNICKDAARALLTAELPEKFIIALRKAAADVISTHRIVSRTDIIP